MYGKATTARQACCRCEHAAFVSMAFAPHLERAHCCREQDRAWAVSSRLEVHRTIDGYTKTPDGCHAKCLSMSMCRFFSHAARWGVCVFCSDCEPKGFSGDQWYTSWRRTVPPPTSAPDLCTHEGEDGGECMHNRPWQMLVNATSALGCFRMSALYHDIVSHNLRKRGMWEIRSPEEIPELAQDDARLPPTGGTLRAHVSQSPSGADVQLTHTRSRSVLAVPRSVPGHWGQSRLVFDALCASRLRRHRCRGDAAQRRRHPLDAVPESEAEQQGECARPRSSRGVSRRLLAPFCAVRLVTAVVQCTRTDRSRWCTGHCPRLAT